jgi:hypothetical protein
LDFAIGSATLAFGEMVAPVLVCDVVATGFRWAGKKENSSTYCHSWLQHQRHKSLAGALANAFN